MSRATRKGRRRPPGDAEASARRAAGFEGRGNADEHVPEPRTRQAGFEQRIAAISRDFIAMAPDQIDRGIQEALRATGEYAGVDRAFLFQLSDDPSLLVNTHEWCADPVDSQLAKFQGLPTTAFPWTGSRNARRRVVSLPRVCELPPEARSEKLVWESVGSKSLIILPLEAEGKLLGALGLDTVREEREWSDDLIALLGTVGEVLANALHRNRRDEALRGSEERFRTLVENAYDLISNVAADGRVLLASPNHREILGWEPSEILGTSFSAYVHPDDEELVRSRFAETLSSGVATSTFRARHKDGTYRWLECTARRYDTPKAESRVVAVSRDITHRKRAGDRIASLNRLKEHLIMPARLEDKLKCITDAVVDMFDADFARIWLTERGDLCDSGCVHAAATEGPHVCRDRDRCLHLMVSSGRYTHTDGQMHRRVPFGCYKIGRVAAAEEAGFLTNDVAHDPRVHDHAWARALGLVSFAGYRLLSDEGAPIGVLALFSKQPLSSEEAAVLQTVASTASQVVLAARSEEERVNLQRQVQHAQKLESLGMLAGGIAHDFNNLLTAILGNAELALAALSPRSPARGNLQEIEKASKRAAELSRQMLAYSGKGRFVVEPIDAGELVEEIAHLLEVSIPKKAVLKYNFSENLPSFDGDVTQIRQVVMNLITNASEALGGEGGVITLSTGVRYCDRTYLDDSNEVLRASLDEPLPEGFYTYFEVSDTGCGMNSETIEKVFDPFFTTKFTGRGLGMSAVLGIVRSHRGTLKINSEVGKGTTFKVFFPANEPSDQGRTVRREHEAEEKDWRGSGTVLIADDEETVCGVGKQMLEHIGFNVLTAADGRDALKVFGEHADEIVCVLLDLTMPRMDGEEAFREMRRLHPGVAVILCSGYNEQDATQRFAGEGLAGFIQKPYQITSLRAKLREVLEG